MNVEVVVVVATNDDRRIKTREKDAASIAQKTKRKEDLLVDPGRHFVRGLAQNGIATGRGGRKRGGFYTYISAFAKW